MKISPRFLSVAAALSLFAFAAAGVRLHPLVSEENAKCFDQALSEVSRNRVRPALAKLEAMLLTDDITVGVDTKSIAKNTSGYDDAITRSIETWHYELGEDIFTRAKDKEIPEVQVKFVKRVPGQPDDVQGMIESEFQYRWSKTSHEFTLAANIFVVDHVDGRKLSADEISQVVTHELGHLLGLCDTSTRKGIMGPFVPGSLKTRPSTDEVEAVVDFRTQLRNSIATISNKL